MSKKDRLAMDAHVAAWLSNYPNERTREGYERTLRRWAGWLRQHHVPYLEAADPVHRRPPGSRVRAESVGHDRERRR